MCFAFKRKLRSKTSSLCFLSIEPICENLILCRHLVKQLQQLRGHLWALWPRRSSNCCLLNEENNAGFLLANIYTTCTINMSFVLSVCHVNLVSKKQEFTSIDDRLISSSKKKDTNYSLENLYELTYMLSNLPFAQSCLR